MPRSDLDPPEFPDTAAPLLVTGAAGPQSVRDTGAGPVGASGLFSVATPALEVPTEDWHPAGSFPMGDHSHGPWSGRWEAATSPQALRWNRDRVQ